MDDATASMSYAKATLKKLLDKDPDAAKHMVQACSPAFAMLGALFVSHDLVDSSTSKEELRVLLGAAFISTLDLALDSILASLEAAEDQAIEGATEVS